MNFTYMIYHVERTRTLAEQRAGARRHGELAAVLTRPWRRAIARGRDRSGSEPYRLTPWIHYRV